MIDVNCSILLASDYILEKHKKTKDKIIGQKCYRAFARRTSICPNCPGKQAIETGKPVESVIERVYDNGRTYMHRVHASPITDRYGTATAFVKILQNITEHKQAEQKLLKDRSLLQYLVSQLSLTEERERRRLATELHDQIGQSLVISKIKLDRIRHIKTSGQVHNVLTEVSNCLEQIIRETRTLTFDLSYPLLYECGFETAVEEWLGSQIREKHGIRTEFEDDGHPKPLSDDIRTILFRNVRELLINIVKHSHADNVRVSLQRKNENIQITITDDGIGFNADEITPKAVEKSTFGLFSIRQRLDILGGKLEIESQPGCGSRITMTAPLTSGNTEDRQ